MRPGKPPCPQSSQHGPNPAPGEPSSSQEDANHDVVRDGEEPPLHEHEPARQFAGVDNLERRRIVGRGAEGEGRVPVGAERAVRVEGHTPRPAQHADVELEDPPRIAGGEQDSEERDDGEHEERDPQEEKDDVVRDRKQPLHQPQPAAQPRIEPALKPHRLVDRRSRHRHTPRSLARSLTSGEARWRREEVGWLSVLQRDHPRFARRSFGGQLLSAVGEFAAVGLWRTTDGGSAAGREAGS